MSDDNDTKRDKTDSKDADGAKEQPRRDVLKGGVVVGGAAVAAALDAAEKWCGRSSTVVVPAHQTSPGAPTPSPTTGRRPRGRGRRTAHAARRLR